MKTFKSIGLLLGFFPVLVFLMWVGCGDNSTSVTEEDNDDDDDDVVDDDDDDSEGPDTEPPAPPTVNDPRTPTSLDFQTITGMSEPGAFIRVKGGADEATTYADTNTGQFCVVVDLILNTTNILAVTAADANNNESGPTNLQIEQTRNNVCLTAAADAASVSYSEPGSVPAKAIDGNKSTYWANTTQVQHPEANRDPQWFRVHLTQLETVNRIDLYWTDQAYGTEFDLYFSDSEAEPVQPHTNANWKDAYTLIAQATNPTSGFNGHNTFDLADAPIEARWILVALYKSTKKNILRYKFELEELEAYSLQSGEDDPGCE